MSRALKSRREIVNFAPKDYKRALILWKRSFTYRKVAQEMGISEPSVRRMVKDQLAKIGTTPAGYVNRYAPKDAKERWFKYRDMGKKGRKALDTVRAATTKEHAHDMTSLNKRRAWRMFSSGMECGKVARDLGVSQTDVLAFIANRLQGMRKRGNSVGQIADVLGCSKSRVFSTLRKARENAESAEWNARNKAAKQRIKAVVGPRKKGTEGAGKGAMVMEVKHTSSPLLSRHSSARRAPPPDSGGTASIDMIYGALLDAVEQSESSKQLTVNGVYHYARTKLASNQRVVDVVSVLKESLHDRTLTVIKIHGALQMLKEAAALQ